MGTITRENEALTKINAKTSKEIQETLTKGMWLLSNVDSILTILIDAFESYQGTRTQCCPVDVQRMLDMAHAKLQEGYTLVDEASLSLIDDGN
ncbi:MAG: hypothetical protein AB1782_14850 [Cyanobacteriota bacterium]